MMKYTSAAFLFIVFIGLSSCQKVIDLKLKESETKYVIEGVITNEAGSAKVIINRTKPFYEDNNFEAVSGAVVTIKANGSDINLVQTSPGIYEAPLIGIPGTMYYLSVRIQNDVFTATSTMPSFVRIDDLYIMPGPFGDFNFATVEFTDPTGISNHYRFVQYLNGVKDPTIFWENDEFINGEQVVLQLDTEVDRQDDPRNIKSGDTVMIELHSIEKSLYHFWYSLYSGGGTGTGNLASPSNPVTNIKGGALGYFSAHTVDRMSVIAP